MKIVVGGHMILRGRKKWAGIFEHLKIESSKDLSLMILINLSFVQIQKIYLTYGNQYFPRKNQVLILLKKSISLLKFDWVVFFGSI